MAAAGGLLRGPEVWAYVLDGHERLRIALAELTEGKERGSSRLPGWTRAHVLSHIEGVCRAQTRQARYALKGELIEVYDGGRPARDAGIEAGAVRTAAELTAAVTATLAEAEAVWGSVGDADWDRPVRYREGDLLGALHCWWRELEVHTADVNLATCSAAWPRELCLHLFDFLAPRAPAGLTLVESDGSLRHTFSVGGAGSYGTVAGDDSVGRAAVVRGRLTDLASWLAGRQPHQQLDGRLPELGPWP
ncbi:maleylpyruvate isomerase family mycothiol-dependent enzyme [Streptomyces sp. NBC_01808]|uniref:maleylpyruvate isomerase family mycothiol-dependent enzyme n=1 Tax=Streptomyces sp. NBC_01808 TaxID=2975947 RepID=UPI002DDA9CBD|nr:maleylpyruvate isomerase family mycothiol-dependent enzyme [Streptomyces sp. NBC_01808]WSA36396.1 maleylpyruvate isomerase family mycothiol-dependent enzyme [Streptomyces sp. NBC_01808]